MTNRTATIIGGIGQTLIALGLCVLLFAGFQLWGTGLQTSAAQNDLAAQFDEQMANIERLSETSTTTTTTAPATDETTEDIAPGDDPTLRPTVDTSPPPAVAGELAEAMLPETGAIAGRIQIDRIGVDVYYVEGVTRDALRKGPGHYPNTPLPGQKGNAAIAGHRTTYGSPFAALDRLEPGDQIKVSSPGQGDFYYEVLPYDDGNGNEIGHKIIQPTEVEVIEDRGDDRLTLTACHPKFSAAQRIVVSAKLVSAPGAPLPTTTTIVPVAQDDLASADDAVNGDIENTVATTNELDESLGWHFEERNAVLLWGGLALLVALAGAVIGWRWKKWPAYALTLIPFAPLLFQTFVHLDRMLPAF